MLSPHLAYIDLRRDTVLYETSIPVVYDNTDSYAPSIISPINGDLLLVEFRDVEFEWIPNTDAWYVRNVDISSALVQLGDDVPIVTDLPPIQIITQEHLVYWSEENNALFAYNLSTAESSFIMYSLPDDTWWVGVMLGEVENTLIVRVRPMVNGRVDRRLTAEYTVRLP